jgi:hypothetical protein
MADSRDCQGSTSIPGLLSRIDSEMKNTDNSRDSGNGNDLVPRQSDIRDEKQIQMRLT